MKKESQDLDKILNELKTMFKSREPTKPLLDSRQTKSSQIFQSPIRSNWKNSGGFSPGVYVNERHQKGHDGIDMRAPGGTPIYPMASGRVSKIGYDAKGGNYVTIEHDNGIRTYSAHLGTIAVTNGQYVDLNTEIGTVGDSGNAKGTMPHVHFQVWVNGTITNPAKFFTVPAYSKPNNKEVYWLSNDEKNIAKNFSINSHFKTQKKALDFKVKRLIKIINTLY